MGLPSPTCSENRRSKGKGRHATCHGLDILQGTKRPDYFSSHRASRRSASCWPTTRPCRASARLSSIFWRTYRWYCTSSSEQSSGYCSRSRRISSFTEATGLTPLAQPHAGAPVSYHPDQDRSSCPSHARPQPQNSHTAASPSSGWGLGVAGARLRRRWPGPRAADVRQPRPGTCARYPAGPPRLPSQALGRSRDRPPTRLPASDVIG